MSENLPTGSTDNPAGLDIVAITRDDEVVEALGLGLPVVAESQADFELAEMLADWRATVHGAPVENLINVDDVERAIAASAAEEHAANQRGRRHLRLVVGAAALIGVALAGLTVLSEGANPNDPLWSVKKVVFKEQAVQTQAAYAAQINLEQAEQALAAGKPHQAREYVRRAQADLTPVGDKQARASMDEWIARLSASAESAIKAAAPSKPQPKKAQRPKQAPPVVTDNMPQYTPPAQRWTAPPQRQQAPVPRQAPEPQPKPQPKPQPGPRAPRPPITILPN